MTEDHQLTWFDRSGAELGKIGDVGNWHGVSLAPDGNMVALSEITTSSTQIRLFDLRRNSSIRLTTTGLAGVPIWSPDGSRVVYTSSLGKDPSLYLSLYMKNAYGMGDEMPLVPPGPNQRYASDWSRDGKYLIYTEVDPKTRADIWYLPDPGKPGSQPVRFLATEAMESQGQLSPDGHWLAYVSVSQDGSESAIYIRDFPGGGSQAQVAVNASEPRWSKSGRELFFTSGTRRRGDVMVAAVDTSGSGAPRIGTPRKLMEFPWYSITVDKNLFDYSPHPDGKRFLINVYATQGPPLINVITSWQKLIPAGSRQTPSDT